MLLKQGDSGAAVGIFQRSLNKLGSILLVDGDFGPATVDAVTDARNALHQPGPPQADDALQAAVAAVDDPFPPLTAAGLTFIARQEVSGPREYRRKYRLPTWPSAESGITIGIGYDLQFSNLASFREDWSPVLPAAAVARLESALLKVGSKALLAAVADVDVPLLAAMKVFIGRTAPGTLDETLVSFPEASSLSPSQLTALVSLVYNRGNRLTDRDPVKQERREMREIARLLAAGDLDAIPAQFESMARLWDPDRLAGLIQRRREEAKLWRSGFEALQLA